MTGGFYRWVGAAFAVLVAVGIGVTAYQAGVMHGLTLQIPAGTTVPAVPYGWHYRPWGFGFGPFFFILLWFLLFRGLYWGGRGWHHRRWDGGVPSRFDEWHRRAHDRMKDDSSSPTAV